MLLVQCAVCGAIKQDGIYDKIKRPIIRTGDTSHGYCDECYKAVCKEIDDLDIEMICDNFSKLL